MEAMRWWLRDKYPQKLVMGTLESIISLPTEREGYVFTGVYLFTIGLMATRSSSRRGRYASYWNAFLFNNMFLRTELYLI